ncbi:hypothetical protein [Klebsiella aerogenes]|uniref:hypothetical protein n=1 Tax=Klebsiella aerogenes TaxID=548 RepID=UPI002D7FC9C4|nr:hypothetical protein [Klebsiella aerogenes]
MNNNTSYVDDLILDTASTIYLTEEEKASVVDAKREMVDLLKRAGIGHDERARVLDELDMELLASKRIAFMKNALVNIEVAIKDTVENYGQ